MKKIIKVLFLVIWTFLVINIAISFCFSDDESPEVLITSVGQSPDARMINIVAKKYQLKVDYQQLAQPDIIKNYKIVVIVVGGSAKGLGAAGIDKEAELARATALIKEIKVRSVKLLVMHIGGEARRGALSDSFLNEVVPYADHLIIVELGNKDNYFTNISKEKEIPLEIVDKILKTGELIQKYFQNNKVISC
ncbi:hypothetical protein ES707_22533 [subsurface metagenome]|jgi:hypothetical protein